MVCNENKRSNREHCKRNASAYRFWGFSERKKGIVYEEAFGYANRNECINNTLQTSLELPPDVKYSQLPASVNLWKMGNYFSNKVKRLFKLTFQTLMKILQYITF